MKTSTSRIELHGEGVGEISEATIERRAAEIAHMDGRITPTSFDRQRAYEDLTGPVHHSEPETQQETARIHTWDEPVGSSGHQAPRIGMDDESTIAEDLVEEGLDEADHEQRLASTPHMRDEN